MRTTTMVLFGLAAVLSGLAGCMLPPDEATADREAGSALEARTTDTGEAELSVMSDGPPPASVALESISYAGSGCPTSSDVSILPDPEYALLAFDAMSLTNPPPPALKTINCAVVITLHVPDGWQFSLDRVITSGQVYLESNIKAKETSRYFLAGNPGLLVTCGPLPPPGSAYPYFEAYECTEINPFSSMGWSPCGGSVTLAFDTSLILNATKNPTGVALFNTDSVDSGFRKAIRLKWQSCAS